MYPCELGDGSVGIRHILVHLSGAYGIELVVRVVEMHGIADVEAHPRQFGTKVARRVDHVVCHVHAVDFSRTAHKPRDIVDQKTGADPISRILSPWVGLRQSTTCPLAATISAVA